MVDQSMFKKYAPQMIADLMHDFGLKDFQAAAFAGNAGAESAGFTDITEDGAIAKGWAGGTGWFQWTGLKSRRGEFEAWLKRKGWAANSYEGNYSFLFRELSGKERASLEAVRKTNTLEEATEVVCRKYERPAEPEKSMQARIRWARTALLAYQENLPKPTTWPGDAVVTADVPQAKEKEDMAIPAIIANPVIMGAIVEAITTALGKAAQTPGTPLQPADVPVVVPEVVKEIQKLPEVQHATNTEAHWWQQRSKWAALFALATPAVAAVTGYTIPTELQEVAITGVLGVGNAIAAYLAYRAGTATKPLFVKEPSKEELLLQQIQLLSARLEKVEKE